MSGNYLQSAFIWWVGDALGVLIMTPLILAWYKTSLPVWLNRQHLAESLLIISLTVLAGQIIFLDWLHDSIGYLANGYWMFLFVVWAAARLDTKGTTIVLLITATQAAVGARLGRGLFAADWAETHFANLTSYMLIMSVVGMSLATYFAARRKMLADLRESEIRFRTVIEQSPIGMSFARDGITIEVNDVYLKMFGYSDMAELYGQPLLDQIAPHCRASVEGRIRRRITGEQVEASYETVGLRKDGSQFPLFISAKRVMLNDGPMTLAFLIDFTERKVAEEKIRHLALHDPLTRLPNRQLLLDRLEHALASSIRSRRRGALLFIDLDNFKSLNDTLGHVMGDLLLEQVALRLATCMREEDTLARFGGDEFIIPKRSAKKYSAF